MAKLSTDAFAAQIKAKYPQYASVDNATLTQKMVTKYPQYADKVDVAPAAAAQPPSLLKRASDFITSNNLPGAQLGTALSNSFNGIIQSVKQRSFEPLLQAGDENNKLYPKVAGDAVRSAVLPASLVVPGAATVVGSAAQFGGLGAAQSGAESLAQGNDYKQAAIDAFKGGLTGAAVGGAAKLAGNLFSKLTARTPEALYNNALKVTQKIKMAGQSPAAFLADHGTWGSLGSFSKAAQEGMDTADTAIAAKLKGAPPIPTSTVLQQAVDALKKSVGSQYTQKQLEDEVLKLPVAKLFEGESIPAEEANVLRKQVDKMLGDRFFQSGSASPLSKEALGAVNTALRNTVKTSSGTEAEFAQLSQWVRTHKAVQRAIGLADSKYGLGLYDMLSGAGGAIIGGLGGDGDIGTRLKNAAVGGVTGLAVERGLNSPAVKTGMAQLLKSATKIPTDTAGKISKAAVTELIARFAGAKQ
jgi:hypothetical protein